MSKVKPFNMGMSYSRGTDEMFIDNTVYNAKTDAIDTASETLLLYGKAFAMEKAVCGTDALSLLAEYEHILVELTTNYQNHVHIHLNALLRDVQQTMMDVNVESGSNILK